jgi:hypothetical protein
MKMKLFFYLVGGLCLAVSCNKGGTTPSDSTEEEVIAVYKGLYRHPCSGHWFTEVNGGRIFFASSEWDAGSFETGVPLQVTFELLPTEQLSCNILPVPDNFRHIRILSVE